MDKRSLKLYAAGIGCLAAFALSRTAPGADLLAVLDSGRGFSALLYTPGTTAIPPSTVLRIAAFLAGVLCFAPAAAPLGRAALRFVDLCRRELGDWWVVGILAVISGGLAVTLAFGPLGREGHTPAEREYDFQARIFAAGRVTAELPATDKAGGAEAGNFVVGEGDGVAGGRWFAAAEPAGPLALAGGKALGIGWLVNPLLGVITTFVLFGYGRRLFGADAALVACLLYAASPFAVFNNASLFPEPAFLLLLLLSLWAVDAARPSGKPVPWLVAGLVLGAAAAAQTLSALAAGIPVAAVVAYDTFRHRLTWRSPACFALGLIIGITPLLLYNYVTSGDFFRFPTAYRVASSAGVGEMALFSIRRLWVAATDFAGWPLISFAPMLFPFLIKQIPRQGRLLYAVAIATVCLYAFVPDAGVAYGARLYYGVLPAALVIGGWGLIKLPAYLADKRGSRPGTAAAALTLALLAGTVPYFIRVTPVYSDYRAFPDGARPWVTPYLSRALEEWDVRSAIVFIAPAERCPGPAPNDIGPGNGVIFARDRGRPNAEFAALFAPRPYILCDYGEFEKTGVLRILKLEPARRAGKGE